MGSRTTLEVLGTPIDVIEWDAALKKIMCWARQRQSSYVAICNTHVVVLASRNAEYARIVAEADMAVPDGAPVAWMLSRLGRRRQPRINGPDLMWKLCEACSDSGVPVYFVGSTDQVLSKLQARLMVRFPHLVIAGMYSPPFQPHVSEDRALVKAINATHSGLVFVGLGCPKQETWMSIHRRAIHGVMLGVGAAFDFHAGVVKRAPSWMRSSGLEWLHRLFMEPRRLWKRYLVTNTLFVVGAIGDLWRGLLWERRCRPGRARR